MIARVAFPRSRAAEAEARTVRIESVFARIARDRMAGLPIVNELLGVAVRGLTRHGDHWLGVLVTPWFMSLIRLPADAEAGEAPGIGAKRVFALPAGRFSFIRHEEEALGGYWSCALFSPMDEFVDQADALAAADAAIAAVLDAPEQPAVDELAMQAMWHGEAAPVGSAEPAEMVAPAAEPARAPAALSRRGLFTLGLSRGATEARS